MNNSSWAQNTDKLILVPLYESIIIIMVLLFALIANGLLIFLFLRDHRMHTTTNFFVMSHIVSEFFASCQGLVISVYVLGSNGCVKFTPEACAFIGSENVFFFYASFLSLTAIAVNRYLAVVKKIHHKITANKAKVIICCLWLLSLMAALPWNFVFTGKPINEQRFLAWLVYCQETPGIFSDLGEPAAIVNFCFAVVCTGVPIVILLVCFYCILKSALRNRRQVSVSYNIHRVAVDAYARSAFTTLLIIAVYLICNAFVLPLILRPSSADDKLSAFFYRSFIWLRSATYPVVYILRNPVYFRLLRHKIYQISSYCCYHCIKFDRTSYRKPQSPKPLGVNGGKVGLEMERKRTNGSHGSSVGSPLPANEQIRAWYLSRPNKAFTNIEHIDCSKENVTSNISKDLKGHCHEPAV